MINYMKLFSMSCTI